MTKLMKDLGLEIPEWTGPRAVEESAETPESKLLAKPSIDFKFLSKEEPLSYCNGTEESPKPTLQCGASLKHEFCPLDSNTIAVKRKKTEPLPT